MVDGHPTIIGEQIVIDIQIPMKMDWIGGLPPIWVSNPINLTMAHMKMEMFMQLQMRTSGQEEPEMQASDDSSNKLNKKTQATGPRESIKSPVYK